jgi:hypothetical protein
MIAAAVAALALASGWAAPPAPSPRPATALPKLLPDAAMGDAGAPPDAFPLPVDATVPRDSPIYGVGVVR